MVFIIQGGGVKVDNRLRADSSFHTMNKNRYRLSLSQMVEGLNILEHNLKGQLAPQMK